jgi:predicted phage terminase large subunit-like protein
MVVRPSDRARGSLRLDEFRDFARSLAKQVWERDDRLTKQAEDQELLAWLAGKFPSYVTKPFAQRHIRLWAWFEELIPGLKPAARVEVWPRGGAKSTTAEMGVARVGSKLTRRFALYVSATQEQADLHVGNIADLFEKLGYDRALNKYGSSKGWRRNQLRVENGFNVQALGLDTASRGIKIEEFRPDLIIFDDIDSQDDSPKTVEKKLRAIKSAIIPAGSSVCAILFIQNLIHEDGIVSQLVDGRADFLLDREVPPISVAVEGLKVESVDRGDGRNVWKITEGTPTWEGQDLDVCERQINEWGLKTFLREAQHEVNQADGFFFDHTKFNIIDEIPAGKYKWCRAWDRAATQGGGDFTAGPLVGRAKNGRYLVADLAHDQLSANNVRALMKGCAHKDRNQFGQVIIHIPQDPGQAGKDQAEQDAELLKEFEVVIEPVSGSKASRAMGWADAVNSGNVDILRADWNHKFIQEHRKFREDEEHEHDDIVDACADGYNTLAEPTKELAFSW